MDERDAIFFNCCTLECCKVFLLIATLFRVAILNRKFWSLGCGIGLFLDVVMSFFVIVMS